MNRTSSHAVPPNWTSQIFSRVPEHTDWRSVIAWWEVRRIPYNVIVGLVGIASLMAFFVLITASGELKGGDAVEPLALMAAPFVINVCYTAGWAVELLVRAVTHDKLVGLSPALFFGGLALTLVIVLLPTVLWAIIDFIKLANFLVTGG